MPRSVPSKLQNRSAAEEKSETPMRDFWKSGFSLLYGHWFAPDLMRYCSMAASSFWSSIAASALVA
eukprot:2952428-Prymnesium_polylepis.1